MSESRRQLDRIRAQVSTETIRVTQHAHEEMVAEDIILDEVLHVLATGDILENYPQYRRGPCCLMSGSTPARRPLHVVCTTDHPMLIIITVYEPRPPRWVTPTKRGGRTR